MYIYTVKEVQFGMLFLIDQQNEEQCSSLNFSLSFFFFTISSNFSYFNRNSLQKILRPKDLRYFCEHKCVKNKLNKVDFEHITDIMIKLWPVSIMGSLTHAEGSPPKISFIIHEEFAIHRTIVDYKLVCSRNIHVQHIVKYI